MNRFARIVALGLGLAAPGLVVAQTENHGEVGVFRTISALLLVAPRPTL